MPIETLSLPFTDNIVTAPSVGSYVPIRNASGNWTWVISTYFETVTDGVNGVTGTGNISVDNTDPQNPIVSITATPSFTTVTATNFVGKIAAAHLKISGTTLEGEGTDAAIPVVVATKGASAIYFNVNSGTRWHVSETMLSPSLDDTYDIGSIYTATRVVYTNDITQKGSATEGYAQDKYLTATASKSFAGEASVTLSTAVPAGAKIVGVALRNDTLVVLGGGGVSLAFAYTGGSSQVIESGVALAKNTKSTKYYDANVDSDIATATTNITVTPDAGTLDTGTVTAVVFYKQLVALTDAA